MRLRQSLQGRGLRSIGLIVLSSGALCVPAVAQRPVNDIASIQRSFVAPPDDARPMMRWWWFGPGVVKPELEREILAMKAGGIGGFEIQPVYPMALDDEAKNFRNLPYLSDEFLDAVKFASETANKNGMRVDMTLASGWPYGGPHVPIDQASEQLKAITVEVAPGADFVIAPAIGNGESLVAAFIADGAGKQFDSDKMTRLTEEVRNGRMALAPKSEPRVVEFFVATGTGQQVKRAAVDADGFVLDHFSRVAIDNHLHTVADRLMTAFGDKPPYAVFSDSLEVYNADWTSDLLAEFQRRRGYDLAPYLPQLYSGTSSISGALRHDWGVTLTELVDERYLTPVNDWAIAHHTLFRSQTYGHPAVSLSSNNLVSLPEGEGPQWKSFSFTRWATSASHLYGRPVTSAETWTWLHSPAFRATPLDMKAEADCFFLEGVNQLIGHGWPYTPPGVAEPGWSFYAAAVFNDHNPWWSVMPDITKYLQRMSYLLRQGKPANDVAVLLPNDDAYANFKPGTVSLSDEMKKLISPALMQEILSAGYNVDYIDAEAIKQVGVPYPVLILPHVERLSPETLKAIAAYTQHGGKVIAVGSTPDLAPGFAHAEQVTSEVKSLSKTLFTGPHAQVVSQEDGLGAALQQAVQPDMKLSSGSDVVGFLHRKLDGADIYFVANTSNHAVNTTATFRTNRKFASSWNPFTGAKNGLTSGPVKMELAPYESRVIVFSDTALAAAEVTSVDKGRMIADLSHGWEVRFPGVEKAQHVLDAPSSWADDPSTRFFSGEAVYAKNITLSAADLAGAKRLVLDFGEGTPVSVDPKIKSGTRALLDGPIREAAVVSVNGKRIGSVWHPPYVLDLAGELHAGENHIEIRVSNTAINELAGRAPADYRLLWARYGQRFIPQDMDNLQPLPSGILGGVHLLEMK